MRCRVLFISSSFIPFCKYTFGFDILYLLQIWDVLSNDEVVEIVNCCPTRSCTARTLVESAVMAWRSKYPTSRVDDCAAVCLFLKSDESTASTTYSDVNIPSPEQDEGPMEDSYPGLDRSGTVRTGNIELGENEMDLLKIMQKNHSNERIGIKTSKM